MSSITDKPLPAVSQPKKGDIPQPNVVSTEQIALKFVFCKFPCFDQINEKDDCPMNVSSSNAPVEEGVAENGVLQIKIEVQTFERNEIVVKIIDNGVIEIKAERQNQTVYGKITEQRVFRFDCSIKFDASDVTTTLSDGILTVKIPPAKGVRYVNIQEN